MTTDRPEFVPLSLRCANCQHEWDDWQPVNVPIRVWSAHIKLLRCPQCTAGPRWLHMRSELTAENPRG